MPDAPGRTRYRVHHGIALSLALALAVSGVVGFVATSGRPWTGHDGAVAVLGLATNRLHATVHLLAGLAGLLLWRRPGGVRGYGLFAGVGFAAVVVYGLAAAGSSWDVLALDAGGNLVHLTAAVLALTVAFWPRPPRPRRRRRGGRQAAAEGGAELSTGRQPA